MQLCLHIVAPLPNKPHGLTIASSSSPALLTFSIEYQTSFPHENVLAQPLSAMEHLCKLCSGLDLASISQANVNSVYRLFEGYDQGRDMFSYTPWDVSLGHSTALLTPYYKSIELLRKSAEACHLCRLIQLSVDTTLGNIGVDARTEKITKCELFLAGQENTEGLQVLGYDKDLGTRRLIYYLLGGVNFWVDSGKERTIIQFNAPFANYAYR